MAITIQPYREEHEPAVRAFNERLLAGQPDDQLVFFERAAPRWLPKTADSDLHNELFLALDGSVVRGGYAIKRQRFLCPDGQVRSIGYYHHPLSEGVIDKAYATIGALLLRDAIIRSPLLYCLGMGGYDRPLAKMLVGLGWSHFAVPFYLRIVRPYRFLREMRALRTSMIRRIAMDLGAFSGAGWAAWSAWRGLSALRSPNGHAAWRPSDRFAEWSDALWERSKQNYALTAVRDSRTLQALYPPSLTALERLRIVVDGADVGWIVVGERHRNPKYGDMRVGCIVDCWALPGGEPAAVRSAIAALEDRGVDLIVTNQTHQRWCAAVEGYGFLAAPSNFIFAASRKLGDLLAPFDAVRPRMHFTRADGDGLPDNF